MANSDLESWLREFPAETVEGRIQELEEELQGLRNARDLYRTLEGGDEQENGAGHPNRPAAIITVMSDEPSRVWRAAEIYREMLKRSFITDAPSMRKKFYATVSRMAHAEDGRLIRRGHGRYRLAPKAGGTP